MALKVGTQAIGTVYRGGSLVTRIYQGDQIAFDSGAEPVEPDPTITFEDTFATLSLTDDGWGEGINWGGYFLGYDVRYLSGNGDQAMKAAPSYAGTGGQTLAQLGLACHEIVNGNLKLYGRQIPSEHQAQFGGFPYVGGMITSELSHNQLYGIVECRARFVSSFGHHWAMWLLPLDGSWPPEIDMVERVRNASLSTYDTNLYMNRHLPEGVTADRTVHNGATQGTPPYLNVGTVEAANDWHDYKFIWTPTTMEWYIDGLLRMSCPNFINKHMYFLISPEIGGGWPGATTQDTVWPMEAEIEYVRWRALAGLEQTLYPSTVL